MGRCIDCKESFDRRTAVDKLRCRECADAKDASQAKEENTMKSQLQKIKDKNSKGKR